MKYNKSNPWIKEREASVCAWKFDYNKGHINNMNTCLLVDFMSFSDRQLEEYVKMLKLCGFTGVQVTDICAAWRPLGSWENLHDKYKILSRHLHENGMKMTVWCWASEFSAHGWVDPDAKYANADPDKPAYDDPEVFAFFNRYYDIYADLAPYADRYIAHFFDPGNVWDIQSVLKFANLLFDKCRAKNPNLRFAMDSWGRGGFEEELLKSDFDNLMLLEIPVWEGEGQRARFRQNIKQRGFELGSWGWYVTDYEVDQRPFMTVNNRVIKDVYTKTRLEGDDIMIPSYWSELDSYHILNFFSLYAAGHLLIDPDADPDALLRESAALVAGDAKADKLLYVLELIRDARSGDSWDSYWWTKPTYVSDTVDQRDIYLRAVESEKILEELISSAAESGKIPLPITYKQFYSLILPHVMQIRQYAKFAVDLQEVTLAVDNGADKERLQQMVNRLDFEVPEYNCIIGLWGQNEAQHAYKKLSAFCERYGLKIPERSKTIKFLYKKRLYERLTVLQRGQKAQIFVSPQSYYDAGMPLEISQLSQKLTDELCNEGIMEKNADGLIALCDWKTLAFDIN